MMKVSVHTGISLNTNMPSNPNSTATRDLEMLASIRNKLDDLDSIVQALQNMNETNTCKWRIFDVFKPYSFECCNDSYNNS